MDESQFATRLHATGRNDACPCGSGKKYKKCHLEKDEAAFSAAQKAARVTDEESFPPENEKKKQSQKNDFDKAPPAPKIKKGGSSGTNFKVPRRAAGK
jgi:hypothetical protein